MKRKRGRPRRSKDIKLSAAARQARRRERLKLDGVTVVTLPLPIEFVDWLRATARENGRTLSEQFNAIIAAARAAEGSKK
jgi:hypothetical protein